MLHGLGQLREGGGNAILHEHLREVKIGPDFECDSKSVATIRGTSGLHVKHVLDAVDLLLDRQRDRLDHRFCARPGIVCRYLNSRRGDRGILRHG